MLNMIVAFLPALLVGTGAFCLSKFTDARFEPEGKRVKRRYLRNQAIMQQLRMKYSSGQIDMTQLTYDDLKTFKDIANEYGLAWERDSNMENKLRNLLELEKSTYPDFVRPDFARLFCDVLLVFLVDYNADLKTIEESNHPEAVKSNLKHSLWPAYDAWLNKLRKHHETTVKVAAKKTSLQLRQGKGV